MYVFSSVFMYKIPLRIKEEIHIFFKLAYSMHREVINVIKIVMENFVSIVVVVRRDHLL